MVLVNRDTSPLNFFGMFMRRSGHSETDLFFTILMRGIGHLKNLVM